MNINNIEMCQLEFDDSIKRIISKIKYENKDILLKLENIKIINFEKDVIEIKNDYTIKELLLNINVLFKQKINIDNILDLNLESDSLHFKCFLNNKTIEKTKKYDAILYISHLEFIKNKIKCNSYIIQIL